jgi:Na+(H+)/acetate symporter ActP
VGEVDVSNSAIAWWALAFGYDRASRMMGWLRTYFCFVSVMAERLR